MEGPRPADQINLTDEESRIMPVSGGGFEQCYNAQAAVTEGSVLVVAGDVVQASNNGPQIEPMLGKIAALPEPGTENATLLADSGYFSAGNVAACEAAGIEPLLAMGRDSHHPSLSERFAGAPDNFLDAAAKTEERAWLDYMRRMFSDATAKIDAVEQSQRWLQPRPTGTALPQPEMPNAFSPTPSDERKPSRSSK